MRCSTFCLLDFHSLRPQRFCCMPLYDIPFVCSGRSAVFKLMLHGVLVTRHASSAFATWKKMIYNAQPCSILRKILNMKCKNKIFRTKHRGTEIKFLLLDAQSSQLKLRKLSATTHLHLRRSRVAVSFSRISAQWSSQQPTTDP